MSKSREEREADRWEAFDRAVNPGCCLDCGPLKPAPPIVKVEVGGMAVLSMVQIPFPEQAE